MTKFRVLFFILTLVIVGVVGYFLSFYAKGYQFDLATFKFLPNGILVIKSNPDGAQVFIDGELKTATNATFHLPPSTYEVSIKKEGFMTWNKTLTIEKEVVTEADAHLFRVVPSLSAVTFNGIESTLPSPDLTKIAYGVPAVAVGEADTTGGLWIMETINLPLGFARDPRRITDANIKDATLTWSPDSRQILMESDTAAFLVETGNFTPQSQLVNATSRLESIRETWAEEESEKLAAKIDSLPPELATILKTKAQSVVFSPDESKVLYTASDSAEIKKELITIVPGASTQPEERQIKKGKTYVYDIKEDRNFAVDGDSESLSIEIWETSPKERRMFWFTSSRHLVLVEKDKVTIMDFDGTNRQVVYTGSFVAPHVFPTSNIDRLLILTNLGANSTPPNIYTLSLK